MRFVSLFLFAFNVIGVFAQKTPFFLTTFYFQDAVGNIDSIEIGFDTAAKNAFNPDYGEVLNQTPFNKEFDVRAVHYFEFYDAFPQTMPTNLITERIVGGAEKVFNAPCIAGEPLIFFIHAIHQPITVSVKSVNDFKKIDCPGHNTWNFFSPDRLYHFIEPWIWASSPNTRFGCLQDSAYSFYLGSGLDFGNYTYNLIHEIEGRGKDTIFGLSFTMDQTFYFCDSTFVATKDYPSDDIYIYPNPLHDYFQLRFESQIDPERISIYNQSGLLIKSSPWNVYSQEKLLNTSELDNGVYYLKIEFKNRPATYKKLIKI